MIKIFDKNGKLKVTSSGGGTPAWGAITGTLSDQVDLQNELDLKAPINSPTFTGTVSGITNTMVGLGNVDNTSDIDKPISDDTQDALDLKYDVSNPANYVDAAGASTASPVQSVAGKTGVVTLVKGDVGLSNVDNTSDINKPVSTAQQTALDLKQDNLSGTGLVKSTAGTISYVTDNSTNWNTAYTNRITSLTTTGSSGAATLIANALNIPVYTASGLGAVTSVSGTTNRITSTGGATPVIDISATFEALLSKISNRIDQNNASTTSAQLASVISDETGTNKLVFSDNPTILSPVLTGVASPTYSQGKLVYDTDNEALTFYNNDSAVGLQIGQEFWIRVKNSTGSSISNGLAVYVNGNDAGTGLPTIALAQANSSTTALAVGLTTETIANGAIGYVTSAGVVRDLDTSAFTNGAILYVSASTPGVLTSTAPSAPNFASRIGVVTKVGSGTTGTISVIAPTRGLGLGTANQILSVNSAGTAQEYKTVCIKDVTDSAAVTGTLTETIVTSLSVPAGMFAQGDIMKISSFDQKLLSLGALQIKYYVNTVNSLSGAQAIFLYSSSATLKSIGTSREFFLKPSTVIYSHSQTANNVIITESGTANTPLSLTFNYANAFFIIKTFVLGNTGDSAIGKSFRVEKI